MMSHNEQQGGRNENTRPYRRMVPHQALHAERMEHKKTKLALEQAQAEIGQLRVALKLALLPMVAPDPHQDFIGHVLWQAQQNIIRQNNI